MKAFLFSVGAAILLSLSACGGTHPSFESAEAADAAVPGESKKEAPESAVKDETILPADPAAPSAVPSSDPAAPSPEAAPAFSLHVDAEKKFETRLGLVKLSWTATGVIDEIYLWSTGFNRREGDGAQEDPCGPIADAGATRHALVNSLSGPNLGFDLNDGSPAHEALLPYLDAARLCDEASCDGFAANPGESPACRIDLDPSKLSGSFYTRTLTRDAIYRLCAKTSEGVFCESSDAVAVPDASVDGIAAEFSTEGKIRISVDYLHAARKMRAPQGCDETDGSSYDDRDRGRGTLVTDCPVDRPRMQIARQTATRTLSLQQAGETRFAAHQAPQSGLIQLAGDRLVFTAEGLGKSNTDSESVVIATEDPSIAIQGPFGFQGCSLENDCEGTVEIRATVSRRVTVTRAGDASLLAEGKTTAGIEWVHLRGNDDIVLPDGKDGSGLPKTKTIEQFKPAGTLAVPASNGETELTFTNVVRNHERFRWKARVEIDGKSFDSATIALPYLPRFEVTQTDAVAATDGAHWDGHVLTLKTQHIKDVGGQCTSPYGAASYSILHPGWGYETTTDGTLHPTASITNAVGDPTVLTCRFWGVSHDGRVLDGKSFTWSAPVAPPPPPEEEGGCFPVPFPPFVLCND
ncbi:MAG TPA: hypothetical protein VFX30_07190 [bacterium]|nr:hypothetical protein [bacterium]